MSTKLFNFIHATFVALFIIVGGGISYIMFDVSRANATETHGVAEWHRPCEGTNIVVTGPDFDLGCDVSPPQTLNVRRVTRRWCNDHGGTFVVRANGVRWCFRIDY